MDKHTEINISQAIPEDAEEIQRVYYETWLNTHPNKAAGVTIDDIKHFFRNRNTAQGIKDFKEKIVNLPQNHKSIVAKKDNKTIGVCYFIEKPDNNHLNSIYVLPEYQRMGIGAMLWKEIKKHFDPNKPAIVQVATYNTKAINFYKKMGFADTGKRFTEERFRMKSGAIIPEMEMVLEE